MVSTRGRARLETRSTSGGTTSGGFAEDVAEDIEEGEVEEPTSIQDLTAEADPAQFDQTFTADAANLTLQGAFDPVAGPKQVLPRVAYTINFNFVWNPTQQRWEPDEGNEGILRAVEDGGTLATDSGVRLNFGNNLSVTTSGSNPTTATIDASGGSGIFEKEDSGTLTLQATEDQTVDTVLTDPNLGERPLIISVALAEDNPGEFVEFAFDESSSSGDTVEYSLSWNNSFNLWQLIIDNLEDQAHTVGWAVYREQP